MLPHQAKTKQREKKARANQEANRHFRYRCRYEAAEMRCKKEENPEKEKGSGEEQSRKERRREIPRLSTARNMSRAAENIRSAPKMRRPREKRHVPVKNGKNRKPQTYRSKRRHKMKIQESCGSIGQTERQARRKSPHQTEGRSCRSIPFKKETT